MNTTLRVISSALVVSCGMVAAAPAQAITWKEFFSTPMFQPQPQPYYQPQRPPYYQPNPLQPFQQPIYGQPSPGRLPIPPDALQQICVNLQQGINFQMGRSVNPRNMSLDDTRNIDYSLAPFGWSWKALWWEAKRSGLFPCNQLW